MNSIHHTGVIMVMVVKVSSIAWNVLDGISLADKKDAEVGFKLIYDNCRSCQMSKSFMQ